MKLSLPLGATLIAAALALPWVSLPARADEPAVATATQEENLRLEKSLQNLSWKQFRSIIEAVPKLKADVEAYGAFGWQYVQANYTTYGWKRNIDRLDDAQKQLLSDLIRRAEATR